MKLAFDIETYGSKNGLSYADFKYLNERGKGDKDEDETISKLSLNPYVMNIISVAFAEIEDNRVEKVEVYYIASGGEQDETATLKYNNAEVRLTYSPVNIAGMNNLKSGERELLERFWEKIKSAQNIVSYNGYSFDAVAIKLRSMMYGLELCREIVPLGFNKDGAFHIDLQDFLSFRQYSNKFELGFVCRQFGIESPKSFMDGSKISGAFEKGDYKNIAKYNAMDALATATLYSFIEQNGYLSQKSDPKSAQDSQNNKPSEKQLNYLKSLMGNSTKEFINGLIENNILTKGNISGLIEYVKNSQTTASA